MNSGTSNIEHPTPNIEGDFPCTLRLLTPPLSSFGEERETKAPMRQRIGFMGSMREWFRRILSPASRRRGRWRRAFRLDLVVGTESCRWFCARLLGKSIWMVFLVMTGLAFAARSVAGTLEAAQRLGMFFEKLREVGEDFHG